MITICPYLSGIKLTTKNILMTRFCINPLNSEDLGRNTLLILIFYESFRLGF